MLPSTSIVAALICSVMQVNGVATISKRTPGEYTDNFEKLGIARTGTPFSKDRDGELEYSKPALFVTTGGAGTGAVVYVGLRAQSPNNVAIFAEPILLGTSRPSSKCVQLRDFYWGCGIFNVQATANLPVSCAMTVQAMKIGRNNVPEPIEGASQVFDFIPNFQTTPAPLSIYSPMQQAMIHLPPAMLYQVSIRSADVDVLKGALRAVPEMLRPTVQKLFEGAGDMAVDGFVDNVAYSLNVACPLW